MGLHGHGLRERQVRGPLEPGGPPQLLSLLLRRFRCVSCGATMTVGPSILRARRLFSGAAIALALALWAASGMSANAVRDSVSPLRVVGPASARTWLTLRRWAEKAHRLFSLDRPCTDSWPPRRIAERMAFAVASLSPGPEPIHVRAFSGAARAR